MKQKAQIVVVQFAPQGRTYNENITFIKQAVGRYSDALVVLPELFLSSYTSYKFINNADLPQVLSPLMQIGRQRALAFVGSLPIKTPKATFNRGLYIHNNKIQTKDKKMLFGAEQQIMKSGKKNPLFFYKDIAFCLQICIDIVDPLPSYVAAKRGALLIINPATVSVDFLRTINKARALENQVTTVFCNRSGSEQNGIRYLGGSSVFFADGSQRNINQQEGAISFTM